MTTIIQKIKKLISNNKGQGFVEYGLILLLIALVVISGFSSVGTVLNWVFENFSNSFVVN